MGQTTKRLYGATCTCLIASPPLCALLFEPFRLQQRVDVITHTIHSEAHLSELCARLLAVKDFSIATCIRSQAFRGR
mgnify:CR=1 FL=1